MDCTLRQVSVTCVDAVKDSGLKQRWQVLVSFYPPGHHLCAQVAWVWLEVLCKISR